MEPMPDVSMKGLIASMAVFARLVHEERPDLPEDYFTVRRAGWLRMGIGSAIVRKVLGGARSLGRPGDDDVIEAKALRALKGLDCLEPPKSRPAFRIIVGSHQLGRLKHNILAAGPEDEIPEMAIEGSTCATGGCAAGSHHAGDHPGRASFGRRSLRPCLRFRCATWIGAFIQQRVQGHGSRNGITGRDFSP